MNLGDLITRLEQEDPTRVLTIGFHAPHSYRGYYEELAFEPREDATIATMLSDAQNAVGRIYEGYKGGAYRMHRYTSVWLAYYGCSGIGLSTLLLEYMLGGDPRTALGMDELV